MQRKPNMTMRPLVGALFLALASPAAMAALPTPPAANVLPGQFYTNVSGTTYTSNAASSATITLGTGTNDVLQFGGSTGVPSAVPVTPPSGITTAAGFNIGSSASLTVAVFAGGEAPAAVLINDITGNPSQIYGALNVTDVSAPVYVANANGVVVGKGATIQLASGGGIIGEAQDASSFVDTPTIYSGNGSGDVTFQGTVTNSGKAGYFLVAGNGNVNVDTSAASMSVVAGSPFSFADSDNTDAVSTTGISVSTAALNIGSGFSGSIDEVLDGGSFSNAGTVVVGVASPAATTIGTSFTNSGTATFDGVTAGTSFTNNGTFNGSNEGITAGTTFVNNGSMSAVSAVNAVSIVNNGSMTAASSIGFKLTATGTAGIVNAGTMNANSDAVTLDATSTSAGSVGISNTGTISSAASLVADVAAGNFVNSGTIGYNAAGGALSVSASNGSITLGGTVNANNAALSNTNTLGTVTLDATSGNVVLGTMLYGGNATIAGNSVTVTSGGFVGTPDTTTTVDVNASSGGALGLYPNTVIAAPTLNVNAGSNNVVLAGTLGNASTGSLSVTAGNINAGLHANGGFSVSSGTTLGLTVAGNVVDDNQPNTTEINYLKAIPVNANGGSVTINLDPTSAGTAKQYVNLGVEGNVVLTSIQSAPVGVPGAIGLNTGTYPWGGLTIQASGSITIPAAGFYYPGQMFFATDNYSPTMTSFALNSSSSGTIAVNGELSNAVPYALPGMGGMAFLTNSAPIISTTAGYVLTNANAWINFPSSGSLAADNQGAQNLLPLGTTVFGNYYGLVNSNGSLTSTLMQTTNPASKTSNKFNSVMLP